MFRKMIPFLLACSVAGMAGCQKGNEKGETGEVIADKSALQQPPTPAVPDTLPMRQEPPEVDLDGCFPVQAGFASAVSGIAHRISGDSLMYDETPLSDCSGIFHRVVLSLQKNCPDLTLPDTTSRSSRAVAAWFFEQNQFHFVSDPIAQVDLIEEGSVLFFADPDSALEVELKRSSPDFAVVRPHVEHVGTVVKLHRKSGDGALTRYEMFHGRSKGKLASVTNWHKRKNRRRDYPPFGNGRQLLIGVGHFIPALAHDGAAD